jgi:hypothetical protein
MATTASRCASINSPSTSLRRAGGNAQIWLANSPELGDALMRTIIVPMLSVGLLVGFLVAAQAEPRIHKKQQRQYDSYARKYPSATPRQLRNARAYDRGEYFEQDSNAHPVGSRGWWELKERESGGDRFRF